MPIRDRTRRAHPLGMPMSRVLLAGVSFVALLAAGMPARAGNMLTGGNRPVSAAVAASVTSAQQAAALSQQSKNSLALAAQALQAMRAGQAAARLGAVAPSLPAVPDGLGPGGLLPDPNIPNDPTLWQGANLPTQTTSNGQVQVDIQQTQQKAILNWQSFNIGSNTTLQFDQQDASWVALNRISAQGVPSQILGSIKALGQIYVINPNGIIFGNHSQVNTHALVASVLDVGSPGASRATRDAYFLNSGIDTTSQTSTPQIYSFSSTLTDPISTVTSLVEGDQGVPGVDPITKIPKLTLGNPSQINVEAGASITTTVVTPDAPGFVYLIGPNVRNSGTITSPEGEVALIAGAATVQLQPGSYQSLFGGGLSASALMPVFRGTGFRNSQYSVQAPVGGVTDDGLIDVSQGTAILNGQTVTMSGVISADTSISRNSSVFIDGNASVDLSGTISMLPVEDGETLPLLASSGSSSGNVQSFVPPSVEASAQTITMDGTGLISAPGATVSLNAFSTTNVAGGHLAEGHVSLASGAIIDVSGFQDVQLPASYNIVSIKLTGEELADFPLQRNGPLNGATIEVDIRDTGTRSDGTTWIGTPVANISGDIALDVTQSIDQLLTVGGSVNITTPTKNVAVSANPDVKLAPGSIINVRGGYVEYLPGVVSTTELLGTDGHIYNIANADPNLTYVGIAGQFSRSHPRWGLTETWTNPLLSGQTFSPDYIEGHDAGGIAINAVAPVLGSTFLFGADQGVRQVEAGLAASSTATVTLPNGSGSFTVPKQGSGGELPSQGYLSLYTDSNVLIGAPGDAGSSLYTSLSASQVDLSADTLSGYQLSALNITASDLTITAGQTVSMAPGGRFAAKTAGSIDVEGNITAPGGQISFVTDPFGLGSGTGASAGLPGSKTKSGSGSADIFIAGVLDARGRWVNDSGLDDSQIGGPGFVNGGSISILTFDDNTGGKFTGNIVFGDNSFLDVSSGGYINQNGVQKRNAQGVPIGKGGSITIATYGGGGFSINPNDNSGLPLPPTSNFALIKNLTPSKIRGFGFSGGGTLTLGAPDLIQIGGTPSADKYALNLPIAIFATGFSSYVVESTLDYPDSLNFNRGQFDLPGTGPVLLSEIDLASGQSLAFVQSNFSNLVDYSSLPTGANIGTIAPLVELTPDLRTPVNLTLSSSNILLDSGSSIVADPKANITFSGTSTNAANSSTLVLGSIIDHGGQVTIGTAYDWLGPQALIDLSGIFIANSTFGQTTGLAVNGTLLAGGQLSIDTTTAVPIDSTTRAGDSAGFVVAQSGAVVDVSGAAGTLQSTLVGPQAAWSDAGTVSINTGTLLWDGTFKAAAGSPQGNGGTLVVGGSAVVVQQTDATVSAALAGLNPAAPQSLISVGGNGAVQSYLFNPPFAFNPALRDKSLNNHDFVSVDHLGAFDTVYLAGGETATSGGAPSGVLGFFNSAPAGETPDTVTFSGDINWTVRNRLYLEGLAFYALAAGEFNPTPQAAPTGAGSVDLNANYVLLMQGGFTQSVLAKNISPPTTAGDVTLSVSAQTIDIAGATLDNFAQANFTATGDIRLAVSRFMIAQDDTLSSGGGTNGGNGVTPFAELVSAGNLTFDAQRLYPETGVDFAIKSTSATGVISFEAPAPDDTAPLSAGGNLTVDAAGINQAGNLFAPLGGITLGVQSAGDLSVNDPNVVGVVETQTLTLAAGSVTSVSLDGLIVPYGQTEDGINWFYTTDAAPLGSSLAPLPAKSLHLNGQATAVDAQATLDLRGGGDLQAIEFVPGTGGSRDVLTTGANGQTVYALLPSQNAPVAASDINFTVSFGDTQPLVGQQIFLAGGNGIAAGFYTLYPAHYATLPGALRVVDTGSALTHTAGQLPDGTQLISGYYAQSGLNLRSSGNEIFAVQSSAVWRQYSEIDSKTANSYFAAQAAHNGVVAPPLPIDGGRMAISALLSLNLGATALAQPGAGGRGSELDIAAPNIDVIGPQESAAPGYLGVEVAQLDNSGFESILIGGTRSDISTGTLITPTAANVRVDNSDLALTAPEVLLVAEPSTAQLSFSGSIVTFEPPATTNIVIEPGSLIQATGSVSESSRNYVLGSSIPAGLNLAPYFANLLGGTLDSTGTVINNVEFPNALRNVPALQGYAAGAGLNSLLLVSNDPSVTVVRQDPLMASPITINFVQDNQNNSGLTAAVLAIPSSNLTQVSIGAGARLSGRTVAFNAPAIAVDPAAVLTGGTINFTASNIALGDRSAAPAGFTVSSALAAELSAVDNLVLKPFAGGINVYGDFTLGNAATNSTLGTNLTLDTPYLAENADTNGKTGDVTISGATVTLLNSSGSSTVSSASGGATLTIAANEFVFGGGNQMIAGFGNIDIGVTPPPQLERAPPTQVVAEGAGTLTLGSANLTMTTPLLLVGSGTAGTVGTGTQFAIVTGGDFTLNGTGAAAPGTSEIGGNLAITAASINDLGTIEALAGQVTLEATVGDVTLGDSKGHLAQIAAGGFTQNFFDVTRYSPGGKVVLTAEAGNVVLMPGSTIDVSEPTSGLASGGELDINATAGSVQVNGAILGAGGPGLGGVFNLNVQSFAGGTNLDSLADLLGSGGFTGGIGIEVGKDNLVLSADHTLTAHSITLTANDGQPTNPQNDPQEIFGQVVINGVINASGYAGDTQDGSGEAGGTVDLYGYNWVSLGAHAVIEATTTHADQRGGDVVLGIAPGANGLIDLQAGSSIDVSGGMAGGSSGGTVTLRAPIVAGQLDVTGLNNGSDAHLGYQDPVTGFFGSDVRVGSLGSTFTGARSVTVEDYVAISTNTTLVPGSISVPGWDGIIDPAGLYTDTGAAESAGTVNNAHINFYLNTLGGFVEGLDISSGLGFGHAATRLGLTSQTGIFHLQPGIELDNPDPNVNGGNIKVLSNWNLAAGAAYDSTGQFLTNGASFTQVATVTDPSQAGMVEFLYRYGIEPGTLTLRAANDVEVDASISDGFFQFADYANSAYQSSLQTYENVLGATGFGQKISSSLILASQGFTDSAADSLPPAPYNADANAIVPVTNGTNGPIVLGPNGRAVEILSANQSGANGISPGATSPDNLVTNADLFPAQLNVIDNRTGDAANPNLVVVQTGQNGVASEGSWSYRITAGADFNSANPNSVSRNLATGHGDVIVAGGTSLNLNATTTINVPTLVRTGMGSITISAAEDVTLSDGVAPGAIYTAGVNTPPLPSANYSFVKGSAPVAGNVDGFLEPQIEAQLVSQTDGSATAAAFPEEAGDISITAGRDITGVEDAIATTNTQLYAPWLISVSQTAPAGTNGGVFAPFTGQSKGTESNFPVQTAWWIQFDQFDQGVLSAGGNVAIDAGRDVAKLSVSLPTTGRVSGGLSATSTPMPQLYGSGNLTITVGRNLESGMFYEGSGAGGIEVRGQVIQSSSASAATILAVDTGTLVLTAGGTTNLATILNPAELHPQKTTVASETYFMDTYGPNSRVDITSISGDVVLAGMPAITNPNYGFVGIGQLSDFYPSNLDVVALEGNITLPSSGFRLANSDTGDFNLLAGKTLSLNLNSLNHSEISAGAALIDTQFDPFNPENGFDALSGVPLLAHEDYVDGQGKDVTVWTPDQVAHLYALTGDIEGIAPVISIPAGTIPTATVEINRPAEIRAGLDIVDLDATIQNIQASDVSSVIAGRDILYTGFNLGGGLQIAGPGFFDVEAGRDLGPFLPSGFDPATKNSGAGGALTFQQGIASTGDFGTTVVTENSALLSIALPVGNYAGAVGALLNGPTNQQFVGAELPNTSLGVLEPTTGARNFLLSGTGASVITMFGVGFGADYAAVANKYINPANEGAVPHNYSPELESFLASLGIATAGDDDAWNKFQALSTPLQHIFIDQVYFAELETTGDSASSSFKQYQRGYQMVNTLFPAVLGYTDNQLGGGTNGANALIPTGDLNLLHATIQTDRGGSILLLGPGGNIIVGSTAPEPNPNFGNNNLGLLTLDGGGIDTFTDESVLVNASRIFTEQGGDIVMWTSNGNLDAGKGSRTTASFPPLEVNFDLNDEETIDLGGLVTGAGIGTLQTSLFADVANIVLIAPRGTVDAGTAGIRSSNGISIAAAAVANAANLESKGATSGVPTAATPNVQALSAAGESAGSSASTAEAAASQARAGRAVQALPSIITVEVLGYGGGEGPEDQPTGEDKSKRQQ